jgi:hypothetical protein
MFNLDFMSAGVAIDLIDDVGKLLIDVLFDVVIQHVSALAPSCWWKWTSVDYGS